jgi:2,3-bisphosphoglycerate-dependent phosphoglycerate mutase
MLELLVIRHAETDWNREHRWQGQTDIPLNATGHAQAQALLAALRGLSPRPAAFISSDLLRARQTAQPLAEAWGLPLATDAGWREQHFGQWEGLDLPAIRATQQDLWPAWVEHDADFALPGGGESTRRFHARVMSALQRAAAQHSGQTIAVLTHGGALDMLWRQAQGLSLSGLRQSAIPNTGINRLHWDGEKLRVLQWAQAAHLSGALAPLPTGFKDA